MILEEERRLYQSHKVEWLSTHRNQFVLIRGTEVAGFFADAESAYASGLERFGPTSPFLVKQVTEQEPVAYVPMLSVGPFS